MRQYGLVPGQNKCAQHYKQASGNDLRRQWFFQNQKRQQNCEYNAKFIKWYHLGCLSYLKSLEIKQS